MLQVTTKDSQLESTWKGPLVLEFYLSKFRQSPPNAESVEVETNLMSFAYSFWIQSEILTDFIKNKFCCNVVFMTSGL